MMILHKLVALIRGHTMIRLIGENREGGYVFVHSPELPGFSFLLEPGEDKDLKTIMDALFEPLVAYLEAEIVAKNAGKQSNRVAVTGIKKSTAPTLAELCYT